MIPALWVVAHDLPPENGYERWRAALISRVGLFCDPGADPHVGSVQLQWAHGMCLATDWECTSSDPRGATMLLLAARRKARGLGFSEVYVHFEVGARNEAAARNEERGTRTFWGRHGEKVMEIFRVKI